MVISFIKHKVGTCWRKTFKLIEPSPISIVKCSEPLFFLFGCRHSKYRNLDALRILVIRLDETGDLVLTSPFLRELRRCYPKALISVLVKPSNYNLLDKCPYIDNLYSFDCHLSGNQPNIVLILRSLFLCCHALWRDKYDIAIVPRWDRDAYTAKRLAYLSGAKERIGYKEPGCITGKSKRSNDAYLTDVIQSDELKHEVERGLDLLRAMGHSASDGKLEAWLSPEDEEYAKHLLHAAAMDNSARIIAVGIGARSPHRNWPLPRYVELASLLIKQLKAKVVVIGGSNEKDAGNIIRQVAPLHVLNIAGHTSLRQSIAVMKLCHCFVGNDSGPLHMAAAAGIPVVEVSPHPLDGDMWASNSPIRFGPWCAKKVILQPPHAIPPCNGYCAAKEPHCIKEISVQQVIDAIESLLNDRNKFEPGKKDDQCAAQH